MLKLLGFLDLLAVVFYILAIWNFAGNIPLIFAIYLIIKSLLFITDWVSMVDLVAGIYLLLIVFNVHSVFGIVFVLWLLQKAVISLLAK